jgi:hypothetical protein
MTRRRGRNLARSWGAPLFLAACVLGMPSLTYAGPGDTAPDAAAMERARLAEEQARLAFADGRFADAAGHFRDAYKVVPDPATKYNEAFAWTKADEIAPAADAYEAALSFGDLPDDLASASSERLTALKARLGYVIVREPLGARVSVAHAQGVPIPARIHLLPGEHELTLVRESGATETRTIEVAAAQTEVVVFEGPAADLQPSNPPPGSGPIPKTADEPSSSSAYPVLGWGLVGLSVAAGVATGVVGGMTLSKIDAFKATDNRDADLRDEAVTLQTTTNVLLAVAATTAAAGVAILVFSPSSDDAGEPTVSLSVRGPSVHLHAAF